VKETSWYEAVSWFVSQKICGEKCEDILVGDDMGWKPRRNGEEGIGVLEGWESLLVRAGVWSVAKMLDTMWLCLFVLVTVF